MDKICCSGVSSDIETFKKSRGPLGISQPRESFSFLSYENSGGWSRWSQILALTLAGCLRQKPVQSWQPTNARLVDHRTNRLKRVFTFFWAEPDAICNVSGAKIQYIIIPIRNDQASSAIFQGHFIKSREFHREINKSRIKAVFHSPL